MNRDLLTKRDKTLILIGNMITLLLGALDSTIVGTAMPKIINDLRGLEYYSWPFTAYMLGATLAIIIFGKLSDLFGRKPIFLTGIITFLAGSILCGLSQNMLQLIFFRGLQGIGGGVLISNSFIIVADMYSPRERGKYMGFLSSMFGLASVIGPSIGGLITDALNWRWVFFVNLPLGAVAIGTVVTVLPHFKGKPDAGKLDLLGIVLLISGLVPFFLVFTWAGSSYAWSSPLILFMLAISILLLTVFVLMEKRAQEPILDPDLFNNRIFSISAGANFLGNALMFCGILFMPLFVQGVIGFNATNSGMIMTPMMLGLTVASITSGQIISRTGKYKILALVGFGLTLVGFVLLAGLTATTKGSTILLYSSLMGLGAGAIIPVFNIAAQNAFSQKDLGTVTASMQFFRNMGATVGSSIFGYIVTINMTHGFKTLNFQNLPSAVTSVVTNPRILVNSGALVRVRSQIPIPFQSAFDGVVLQAKSVLAHSITTVFQVAIGVSVFALILALFLKEIPLTHFKRPAKMD